MANIDNLTIEISADASKASSALQTLTNKLEKLSTTLNGINGSGISNFATSMTNLTTAMQGLKSVNASQFTKVAKGIKKFEEIDGAKISQVANSIEPIANAINTLNGLTFDGKNVTTFVNAITKLSAANPAALNSVNFEQLGNSIRAMTSALSGAEQVSANTISFTNAIAKLAATGGSIATVNATLPQLATTLNSFMTTMAGAATVSETTVNFTSALASLAATGETAALTAVNLDTLQAALTRFFTAMSQVPEISTNVVALTQALAQLASQGSAVAASSTTMSSGLNRFSSSANKASKKATGLASAIGKFYASWFLVIRLFSKLGDSIDLASDLTEAQNVVDVTFKQYSDAMEDFAGTVSMTEYGISELTAKEIGSRYQAMSNAIGLTNDAASSANDWLSTLTDGYVEAGGTVADMSVNITKLAADMASLYNEDAEDVAEALESIYTGTTKPLRQYGLDLTEATLQEWAVKNGLDADISSMTQAEKVMLRYQYVLANTTDAQGDFARTADTWANRIKVLKQQLQAWGAVVGQVFISALKPALRALNSFMTEVIEATTAVANALGKIFGWTIDTSNVYGSTADDTDEITDALDDATDAAAEFNKQLQGFDKLNNLTSSDDDSGSGDSDSSLSALGDASIVSTDESLIKYYESEIDSLYELGSKISEALTTSMESIDWDATYQSAKDWGKGLASFLNGLITPELFGELGTTLASAINTVVYGLQSFGYEFDWEKLGESLSTGVNDFFETLDVEALADTINTYVEGALDTAATFLTNTDFEAIGEKIGTFLADLDLGEWLEDIAEVIKLAIEAAIDLVTASFEEAPLETAIALGLIIAKVTGAGKTIASQIATKLGITKVSLEVAVAVAIAGFEVGQWLYENVPVIQAISDTVGEWIFGEDYENSTVEITLKTIGLVLGGLAVSLSAVAVEQAIKTAIKTATGGTVEVDSDTVKVSLASKVFSGISSSLTSLGGVSGLLTTDLGTIFGAGTAAEIGLTVGTGIIGGIAAAFAGFAGGQKLYEWLTGYVIDMSLTVLFMTIGESISDGSWSGALEMWGDDIESGMIAIADTEQEAWDNVVDNAKGAWSTVKTTTTKAALKVADAEDNLWEGVKTTASDAADTVYNGALNIADAEDDLWSGVKSGANKAWSSVKSGASGVADKVYNTALDVADTEDTLWSNIKTGAGNAWSTVSTGATNAWDSATTAVSSAGESVGSSLSTLKDNASTTWTNIKDNVTTAAEDTKTGLSEKWTNITETASEKWDSVKTTVGDTWTNISEDTTTKWDTVKSDLGTTWDNVSSSASEKFTNIKDSVGNSWDKVKEGTTDKWNTVKTKLTGTWNTLKSGAQTKFSGIKDNVSEAWNGVKNKTTSTWNKVKEKVSGVGDYFANDFSEDWSTTWTNIVDKFSEVFSGIKEAVKTPVNAVIGFLNTLIGGVETAINAIIQGLNNISVDIPDAVANVIGFSSFGFNISEVSFGRISEISSFATGGFPAKSSLFFAGEGGIPELLGTVGGQTAVAGGAEITGIADAVRSSGATEASLLQMAVSLLQVIADKDTTISSDAIYASVRKSDQSYVRRTGKSAFSY